MAKSAKRQSSSSSSSTSTSKSNNKDGSFLAKLETLRSFCDGLGFSESDLSTCLRASCFNVESAAERLMTGQYKSAPKKNHAESRKSSQNVTPSPAAKKQRRTAPEKRNVKSPVNSHKTTPVGPSFSSSLSSFQQPMGSAVKNSTRNPEGNNQKWLLCRRWISGSSNSRNGRTEFKESLSISTASHGPPICRFSGASIEGTLPQHVALLVTPLLRYNNASAATGSTNNIINTPLISLSAEAMMQDRGLAIGAEVPLCLSVYIEDPRALFDILSNDAAHTPSKTSFFATSREKGGQKLQPLTQSIFGLLQWAQYGDDHGFESPTAESCEPENGEEEEEGLVTMEEDEFQAESQDPDANCTEQTNDRPEWATSIFDANTSTANLNDNGASLLPEATDPVGLTDGITLRSYQKQALHWMMEREAHQQSRESVDRQIAFLSELAGADIGLPTPMELSPSQDGIVCECGPVLVSEATARESKTINGQVDPVNHPLWKRRFLANPTMETTISFYVNELLFTASADPPNPPRECSGGMLCDAMGLGKSVMIMSLILKSIEKAITDDKENKSSTGNTCSSSVICLSSDGEEESNPPTQASSHRETTLVVAPLSLISQWEEELATKTSLSHHVHYGDSSKTISNFQGIDVVVTTYGTIQGEFLSLSRSKRNSFASNASGKSTMLLSFDWHRVVLDEAHCIKNPGTAVSKACCLLKSKKRWCVTGTPIQNSLQDVYGLLKFLRHEPWCEGGFWKTAITSAVSSTPVTAASLENSSNSSRSASPADLNKGNGMRVALDRVRRVLSPLILRRTKESLSKDGTPILILPPIDSAIVNVALTGPERDFYKALLAKSQSLFEGYIKSGTASKSWFAIFSLLQRLRQTCDHISLTVQSRSRKSDCNLNQSTRITDLPEGDKDGASDKIDASVDGSFLSELLEKFRTNNEMKSETRHDDPIGKAFVSEVAHSLTKSVMSNAINVEEECPICLDKPNIHKVVWTPCAHFFCRDCLVGALKEKDKGKAKSETDNHQKESKTCPSGECPSCNEWVDSSRIIQLSKSDDTGKTSTSHPFAPDSHPSVDTPKTIHDLAARSVLEKALTGATSSKMQAVIDELKEVWRMDPCSKVLIFSQFLGFLDLLEVSLKQSEIPFSRLDGKMSLKERVASLQRFNSLKHPPVQGSNKSSNEGQTGSVFLVSMRAGGVGMNLVAASTVFIVDPWWNAAVEDQCINRIHRIGQTAKIVRVRKFVVLDSVEEKIVQLQKRKKDMASEILSDNQSANSSQFSDSNPTMDDFKLLFGR